MRRQKRLERIDKVIDRVLRYCGIEDMILEKRVLEIFPRVVEEKIASHIKSLNIEDRILFVKLDSPTWANQMLFLKRDVLKKINSALTKKFIRNIIFRS